MDTSTDVILSIKPKYAEAIISGTKKVEFRKKIFKRQVDKVYIYSSSPTKKLIGYFTFTEIVKSNPNELWRIFENVGAINKDDFFEYFRNCENGFAILVDNVARFIEGVDPSDYLEDFIAPQSYTYVNKSLPKFNVVRN